jgi:proliferating cell nuclear antigen
MRIVVEKADSFKRCVDAIATLIDEAEFVFDESGITLKATDPSQISMVDFVWDKKSFQEFSLDAPQRLGLDLSYLSQVMSRSNAKDSLIIELGEDRGSVMVTFKGASTRTFKIPLIDVSNSQPPQPKIEFEADTEVKAGVVQGALKDAVLVSSHVTLGVDEKNFFVKAQSSKGSLINETPKGDPSIVKLEAQKACNAMFPLDYLNDMFKVAGSDDTVSVNLKTDAPVRISYAIGGATITYYLAPRIEAD